MIFLFKSAFIIALGIFLLPRRWKGYASLLPILLLAIPSTYWAIEAFLDGPQQIDLFKSFWSGDLVLVIDRMSSFFILIINLTCVTGIIYSLGYTSHYLDKKGAISISLHFYSFIGLQFAMLLVVMLRDGFAFLVAWELMSLFSFVLVIFEGEKEATLKTGITYLVQMHMGFTLLLIAFLYVNNEAGAFGFDALQVYFSQHNNFWLFLLFFLGFGIKAGFVPLHSWLPHAHPAAPSHVSGVMSGVMIKMGLYGILRVLTHVQSQFLEIGFFILCMGVITALTGILYAIFQKDVKKTLAYSSIENIGIIGIGIGFAWVGKGLGNELLMTLAMASALLHIFNHSLYKSLLFYTAGNIYYATHTRDLDRLGGLAKTMPVSALFFMVGALAISALPPFNGFISEFLLYKGVFENITASAFDVSLINLAVLVSLVVIGGLSVFAFTKTFGIAFLGSRRTPTHHEAKEVPLIMRIPGFIIIPIMLSVCLFPNFYLPWVFSVAGTFTNLNQSEPVMINTLETLYYISMGSLILLVVFAIIMGVKKLMQAKLSIVAGPTWGCGYTAGDFKHQYTSTSYIHNVRELVGPLVDIQGKHTPFEEQEIFPSPRHFATQMTDLIEEKVVLRPVEYVTKELPKAGWAQSGMINHYLVYPLAFLIIVGLLTLIGLM
ncbi:MAG: proton-conducting transporter membrane subunit [Cyclobacteriaceae bacterium]